MTDHTASAERKPFKSWFDTQAAKALGAQVAAADSAFDRRKFVRLAARNLDDLEFSGRVKQFSEALAATLPGDVPRALATLTESLPPVLADCEAVTDGWLQWPIGQFIADHGLPHFEASMDAMVELTRRFTSEFAVRPFVEAYPRESFSRLSALVEHPDPHVRRWCSEGTRPRLPWGKRLDALVRDPAPILPILEALKDDPELYVRRSVANNLNDIAKDHGDLVIGQCAAWAKGATVERDWVIKHALRSLIKAGDRHALGVVGFGPPRKLKARLSLEPERIEVGGYVAMTAKLTTTAASKQRLTVDYVVHYVRKSANPSAKVFKWTTLELPARGTLSIDKRHSMRETTVRALYPGAHRIGLQVNGEVVAEAQFHLASAGSADEP